MSAIAEVRPAAPTLDARQQLWWDEHAAFINALVDEGNVLRLVDVKRWEVFIDLWHER